MNFKQLCEIAELTDEEAFKANLDSMKLAVYRSFLNKGKKVGFVYGVDKPRLLRDDANIYFAFLDVLLLDF